MKIIHKEPEFAVVLKAAGELSEGASPDAVTTLLAAELAAAGEASEVFPVHRLDRATAGLLVLARTQKAAASLSLAFADGRTEKEYTALCEGTPDPAEGEMTDLLYFDRARDKSFVVTRKRNGVKEARLAYTTVTPAAAREDGLSLVRVRIFTGRTHQIRVQFASRRLPLAGDRRYGAKTNRPLALFSSRLAFPHPKTGKTVVFTAEAEF